jgi:hypothetical protein
LKYPSQPTRRHTARLAASKFAIVLLLLLAAAHAQTITGTVKNGTTNKPGAGDEVALLTLSQGMDETGKTTTDAKGNFSFKLDDASAPHLIRVTHQGVPYHRMVPPGTTSVEVEIYDVAKKVQGLSVTADVVRLQAQGSELSGIRLFAVNNASSPARTQMNEQNFEFYLPDGAQIDQSMAMTAGGQPISSDPVPEKEKNRYAFTYPLRPGETQFQVSYHMPYSGSASIDPKSLYDAQHVVVMLPKSMQFTAGTGAAYQSMQDPQQSDSVVEVASNTTVGQPLNFKISGTGILSAKSEGEGNVRADGASAGRESRPGGGLGPPIDAPDPLEKYRWFILGGFGVVLAGGAIYISGRSKTAVVPGFSPSDIDAPPVRVASKPKPAADRSGLLMEALKEELFQLEVEHKQGRITQAEYDKAKAALDQTLERAIKRGAVKTS